MWWSRHGKQVNPTVTSGHNEVDLKLKELAGKTKEELGQSLELYKQHQDRVQSIRSQLWAISLAFVGLQIGVTAYMVKDLNAKFLTSRDQLFWMDQPLVAVGLAFFGIVLSFAMMKIIHDMTKHIESNWRSADIALGVSLPHVVEQDKRKRLRHHTIGNAMAQVGTWIAVAQVVLGVLAVLVILEGLSYYDVPFMEKPAASAPATSAKPPLP